MRKMMTIAFVSCMMFWYGVALAVDMDGEWFCMAVADNSQGHEYNMTSNGNVSECGAFTIDGGFHSETGGAFSHKFKTDKNGQWFRLIITGGHFVEYLRDDE